MVEFKLAPFEETKKENTDFKLVDPKDSEFKLVPLKVSDEQIEQPGFIDTLKNPLELWKYNSIPVAAAQIFGEKQRSALGKYETYLNNKGILNAQGEPFDLTSWMDDDYTTKSKQRNAQESKDWLEANPDIKTGKEFNYHKDMYNRYGYALSTEPFSMEAVVDTFKAQPKVFAGELVNALVADPYLLIPWFWGGWAAKAAQTTQIGTKAMATAPALTKGITTATATIPTLTAYSTIQQYSESGELDFKRIQGEVMLGGASVFILSTLGAAVSSKSSRMLGLTHDDITLRNKNAIDKLAADGDPWAQRIIKDSNEGVKPFEESLKSILDDIEASDLGVNSSTTQKYIPTIETFNFKGSKDKGGWARYNKKNNIIKIDETELSNRFNNKAWTKPKVDGVKALPENSFPTLESWRNFVINHESAHSTFPRFKTETLSAYENRINNIAKQFKTKEEFALFQKELATLKNNPKYKNLPDDLLFKKAKTEYYNKTLHGDKVKQAMIDEIMPDVRNTYNQMLLGGYQRYFGAKTIINNKALINNVTTMGAGALLVGAGYYIKNPKDGAFWEGFAKGFAGIGLWKSGGAMYARNKMLQQGNKLKAGTTEELGIRLREIKADLPEGVKLEDIGIHKTPEFYTNQTVSKADLRRLGRAEEIQLAKGEVMSGYLLDGYRTFVQVAALESNRMKEIIIGKVPDINRRKAITKYIQEEKKVTKLSKDELDVAKDVTKVMNEMWKVTQGTELKFRFFENYLPQYWRGAAAQTDVDLSRSLRELILDTSKKQNAMSGRNISEFQKFFPSYEAGIAKGLEPLSLDIADIMTRYVNSTNRSLAQRRLVRMIQEYEIPGRSNGVGGNSKLMYKVLPDKLLHPQDYIKFYHPSFLPDNIDITKYTQKQLDSMSPFVLREAAPMLRMLFDARDDSIAMKAISNINFLQKRFSVGYSFFHAETLLNNMLYAGFHPVTAVQTGLSATGLGSIFKHLPGGKMIIPEWETTSARAMLKAGGHYDMLKAATKAGVEFSHPDDVGISRFYNSINNIQQYLDTKIPYAGYLAKQGIEYAVVKPFQYIDRVTWDRVFNVGKLYAFQTNALKIMENPKYQNVPLKEIHRQAAIATNDMYGGLNWMQLYKDTADPLLKDLKANLYNPKGRRYLQLMLFAPDWTTANFRVLTRAMPGLNQNKMSRKLYQAYALRAGIILATGGSALNYMFTGKMLWDNDDPTRIDLGNGYSLTLSKQYFEPFHWAVNPVKTALSKQGSFLKMSEQLFFNKQYLTSPWPSPISKADRLSLERVRDYSGAAAITMVPFGFRRIVENIMDGDKITVQDAVGFLLSNLGHPMYKNPRKPKYPGYIELRNKIFNN